MSQNCYCCSGKDFTNCCEPLLSQKTFPETPEMLMRSRYTAYVLQNADYLIATTAKATRRFHNKTDILNWARQNHWTKLEVLHAINDIVEFKAYYLNSKMQLQVHHEKSQFVKENNQWKYLNFANS